jgi:hypothetical protein
VAIRPVTPPAGIIDRAVRHIQALVLEPDFRLLGDVPPDELELVAPHRVYVLPFDAVRHGQLSRATFAGWRFLIVAGDNVIASADVQDDVGHSVVVSVGPLAASTAAVIDHAGDLPEVRAGDVELRILKANALYLTTAWLANGHQLFIPLEPAPSFVQAGRAYTEDSFFEALNQPGVRPFTGGPARGSTS